MSKHINVRSLLLIKGGTPQSNENFYTFYGFYYSSLPAAHFANSPLKNLERSKLS